MTLPVALFAVVATVTAVSALGVVLSRNIVRMAVWLLFTLIGVSLLYFLLGAEFVGAAQLIVYVGGTLVLVVFGVMLTAQGPLRELRNKPGELGHGRRTGRFAVRAADRGFVSHRSATAAERQRTARCRTAGARLSRRHRDEPERQPHGLARQTCTSARTPVAYLLPFEIVSVHLLVVLVGAAYLARAKRRVKS